MFSLSAFVKTNPYHFAQKLYLEGYTSLALKKYEVALSNGFVSDKEIDAVYLKLFKLNKTLAHYSVGTKKNKFKAQAKIYFDKIQNRGDSEIKLEVVKSSLENLRKIHRERLKCENNKKIDLKKKKEISAKLIAESRIVFAEIAVVSNEISKEARRWLNDYQDLKEVDQKRNKNEFLRMAHLEGAAYLQFGEACVLYANIAGHKDPEVRKWLLTMVERCQDFIYEHYNTYYAWIGGIYIGEAYTLLEKFNIFDEPTDGVKLGSEAFTESINALNAFASSNKTFKEKWLMVAYKKKAAALELIGRELEALDTYRALFKWKDIASVKPKQNSHLHFNLMYTWQRKCELLRKIADREANELKENSEKIISYKGWLEDLYNSVSKGFNVTKKMKSPWHVNFKIMLGKLPDPKHGVVLDLSADATFLKAKEIYTNAMHEVNGTEKLKITVRAAELYKKVLGLVSAENKKKIDELYPESALKLGLCYLRMENYLLSIATFSKAVELYPSEKYTKIKHPEIYKYIRSCAINAEVSARKRYIVGGKNEFDLSLYIKTLKVISDNFSEEGGDPDYKIGYLYESGGEYNEAKRYFEKVKKTSIKYLNAKYHILNCDYLMYIAKPKGLTSEDEIQFFVSKFKETSAQASIVEHKPDNIHKKEWDKKLASKKLVYKASMSKVAKLTFELKDYSNAKKAYLNCYLLAQNAKSKRNALNQMIICDYKNKSYIGIAESIERVLNIKVGSDYTEQMKKKDIANYIKMQSNLVLNELNALAEEGTSQESEKALKLNVQLGDLFMKSIEVSGEKDVGLLSSAIHNYLKDKGSIQKALNALNIYFQWNSNQPNLDTMHTNAIGLKRNQWDGVMGSYLSSININKVKSKYSKLLDYLFDEVDYSKMSIAEVFKHREATTDMPRNYMKAYKVLKELKGLSGIDMKFKKEVLPHLLKLEIDINAAKIFYNMRFKQAECYSLLGLYGEAADVYKIISKYYVEYPSVRMGLYKSLLCEANEEGLKESQKGLGELLNIVRNPMSRNYSPYNFYSLVLLKSQTDYALIKDKNNHSEILKVWQYLRSNVFLDARYLNFDKARFKELKILESETAKHTVLIKELQYFAESKLLAVVNDGKSTLKNDSWSSIVGNKI